MLQRPPAHSNAAINVASSHAHGGFPAALDALAALAPAVLFGEGFWMRHPSSGLLEALGGATADELADLRGLRAAIRAHALEILGEWIAGAQDWAQYERTLARDAERDGAADSLEYAERIRSRRALPDGADTLGFGLFVLRRR